MELSMNNVDNTNEISVYIVEDYLLTRTALKKYLSKTEGVNVLGDFETAESCLYRMKWHPVDIVLMDLGLPMMNGLEATQIINERHPNTKVIILTSHENTDEIFACMASGANAYVLKDCDIEELAKIIKLVNSGAVWLDSRIAKAALSIFPQPDSTNFNNLYLKKSLDINLTDREREVLKLIIQGKTNPEIAKEIYISPHTAKSHVCKILNKLAVKDRVQAAVKAIKYELLSENDYA